MGRDWLVSYTDVYISPTIASSRLISGVVHYENVYYGMSACRDTTAVLYTRVCASDRRAKKEKKYVEIVSRPVQFCMPFLVA